MVDFAPETPESRSWLPIVSLSGALTLSCPETKGRRKLSLGELLFWLFIGGPIVLTVLYWILMLVCAPFFAIGAGAQAVKESREEKRRNKQR